MTNARISDLPANNTGVKSTDVFPSVQTPGIGPIKSTAAQIKDFVLNGSIKAETATDYGAVGNGVTDDTAALQAMFDAARDSGRPWVIPPGTFYVASNVTIYNSGFCYGAISAVNSGSATPVVTVAPLAADVENVPLSSISGWGDIQVGQSQIPAATDLAEWYYFLQTNTPWIVRYSGSGTFNRYLTMRFNDDAGRFSPAAKVAFTNASIVGVKRKKIRNRITIQGLNVVFASGSGESVAVKVTRPNVTFEECVVRNSSAAPLAIGFGTQETCLVDFRDCYVFGMKVNTTNYGFGLGNWSFDCSVVNCRETFSRRGFDVQNGWDMRLIGGSYPSGVGGHWGHNVSIQNAAIGPGNSSNPNPVQIAGSDWTVEGCELVVNADLGNTFVNMREDLPEISGGVFLQNNIYILNDPSGALDSSGAFIYDHSFGALSGYDMGRQSVFPKNISIIGGRFVLNRTTGNATAAFVLNVLQLSYAGTSANSVYGYVEDTTVLVKNLAFDYGVITNLISSATPRTRIVANKTYDASGNGALIAIEQCGPVQVYASAASTNVDTPLKRTTARLDFYIDGASIIIARVADGVARRVIARNFDTFTRSKPTGTSGYTAVGDEIFGAGDATGFVDWFGTYANAPTGGFRTLVILDGPSGLTNGQTLSAGGGTTHYLVKSNASGAMKVIAQLS